MPIGGLLKTAVGTLAWSTCRRVVVEQRLGEGAALGDRDRRQVQPVGDVADRVDVVDVGARHASTMTAPSASSSTPASSRPSPSVLGMRPVAQHDCVGVDRSPSWCSDAAAVAALARCARCIVVGQRIVDAALPHLVRAARLRTSSSKPRRMLVAADRAA